MVNQESPHLTESYAKVRKSYGIFAATLLAWELIGVGINEATGAGFKITLKTPDAIPFVLLVLVAYLAIRLWIEWKQNATTCRQNYYARFDYIMSHTIGALSVIIWGIQYIFKTQIYNQQPFKISLFGLSMGLIFASFTKIFVTLKAENLKNPENFTEPMKSSLRIARFITRKRPIMWGIYMFIPSFLVILTILDKPIIKTDDYYFIISLFIAYIIVTITRFPYEKKDQKPEKNQT